METYSGGVFNNELYWNHIIHVKASVISCGLKESQEDLLIII